MLTTAVARGSRLRETIVCSALITCAAATTGSRAWWGAAPCPPFPRISISSLSAPAITGPSPMPTQPTGRGIPQVDAKSDVG